MANAVEALTPTLRSNPKAVALAKSLDNKSNMVKNLKGQLEEKGSRPSGTQRAFAALTGAGMTGVMTGMVADPKAKIAISAGVGIVGVILGTVLDSNMIFDGAVGAGAMATGWTTDQASAAALAKLKQTATSVVSGTTAAGGTPA